MPEVSILIPAYNPRFFEISLTSALSQDFTDIEIIVSDDSEGTAIESITERHADGRLRYTRNPTPRLPGANRDHLLTLAQGEYVKFLFDDDILLPHSVRHLHRLLSGTTASLSYHPMLMINEMGDPTGTWPPTPITTDHLISQREYLTLSLLRIMNHIGGPTAVMIRRSALDEHAHPFWHDGRPVGFLTDVSLYMNLMDSEASFVGSGIVGACFRTHTEQTSNASSPLMEAGVFEWERLLRYARREGVISDSEFTKAMTIQLASYRLHLNDHAALGAFIANTEPIESTHERDAEFRVLTDRAYATISERLGREILQQERGVKNDAWAANVISRV